jgi:hypothetical protein
MSDDGPEPEPFYLDESALKGEGAAARELAKFRARLRLRPLAPDQLARLMGAVAMGEALGRSEGDGARRERTVFPHSGDG